MLTFPVTFFSGDKRIVFTGNASTTATASSYTFSSQSIGVASAQRYILVGFSCTVSGADQSAPNALTVGGQTCSVVQSNAAPAAAFRMLWITDAVVTTGTTASIVASRSGNMSDGEIVVWALYDMASNTATDAQISSGANPRTITLTTTSGGVVAGFAVVGGSTSFTWTNLTEDVDAAVPPTYSGASISRISGTSLAVTSSAASAAAHTLLAASFF